jgi:hypothetical protein
MGINTLWHAKNRMPKAATMQQKAKWHTEHVKNCGCRPIPKKVLEYLKGKGGK